MELKVLTNFVRIRILVSVRGSQAPPLMSFWVVDSFSKFL